MFNYYYYYYYSKNWVMKFGFTLSRLCLYFKGATYLIVNMSSCDVGHVSPVSAVVWMRVSVFVCERVYVCVCVEGGRVGSTVKVSSSCSATDV